MILLRCLSPPHRVAFQDRSGGMSNGQGKHNNPTMEMLLLLVLRKGCILQDREMGEGRRAEV